MAKEIDKQLDEILNIESDIKEKTQVVKLPERSENIETDYRYARENLYGLVERGQDAIEGILQLSKESEHPRAYEVAGQLIKTVGETAEKLIDLQQKYLRELGKKYANTEEKILAYKINKPSFSFYSNINYYRGLEPNVIILTRVDKLKFLENEFEILDTQGNYLLIKIADE